VFGCHKSEYRTDSNNSKQQQQVRIASALPTLAGVPYPPISHT
jgi:hypothetical protein